MRPVLASLALVLAGLAAPRSAQDPAQAPAPEGVAPATDAPPRTARNRAAAARLHHALGRLKRAVARPGPARNAAVALLRGRPASAVRPAQPGLRDRLKQVGRRSGRGDGAEARPEGGADAPDTPREARGAPRAGPRAAPAPAPTGDGDALGGPPRPRAPRERAAVPAVDPDGWGAPRSSDPEAELEAFLSDDGPSAQAADRSSAAQEVPAGGEAPKTRAERIAAWRKAAAGSPERRKAAALRLKHRRAAGGD